MFYGLIWIFICWHYALRCGFISDDHAVLEKRTDIIPDAEKKPQQESYWIKVFNDGILMYYLNRVFFLLKINKIPFVWHSFCLAIHLLNAYLLYLVLVPHLGDSIAQTAAFFWAINPMLNQNVVWISGRPYIIATMLVLVGMLYWTEPYIFIPLYGIAVITNISVALVPLILKMMYPDRWQGTFYVAFMFGCGMPFILWKFYRRFTKSLVIDRENFRYHHRRWNNIVRVYAYYLWTILCPVRMGWYHQAGFRYNTKWDKFNVWTLIGYALCVVFMKLSYPGWWFLLGILPNANIYVTNSFVQDRYVYFGSMGLWIILAPFIQSHVVIFVALASFYIVRSYMYSRHLKNDEMMYRENWRNHPNSDYAVNNLSFFLIQRKRFDEARVTIQQGIALNPRNKMLWYNLGVTWACQGNFNSDEGKYRFLRALDCWKKALEIEPRWKKPAEDTKKMIKLLVDNKVLTANVNDANPNAPVLNYKTLEEQK